MPRITVEIPDTLSEQQRSDPRFKKLLEDSENFFNCPCCCTENFKLMLGLHEAGHSYFAKKAGASNIKFFGPEMCWDWRNDRPAIINGSTGFTEPEGSCVDVVKAFTGGYICRRQLSPEPNEMFAIGSDILDCRKWFDSCVGTGDAGFEVALEDAEREILEDLKSPAVVREIHAEAIRFVCEIFPNF